MGRKSSHRYGGRRTRRMRGGYEGDSTMDGQYAAPAPADAYPPEEEEEEEEDGGWFSKIGSIGSNMGSQLGSMGSRIKESTIGGRRRRRTMDGGRRRRRTMDGGRRRRRTLKGGRKSRKGGRKSRRRRDFI